MRLLMRFLKPYRGLVAVTLLVLLVDNVGTLLVPTMLANMVNTGITTGDVDYILRNGLYMFIATSMASGGTVLGCYLSARLAASSSDLSYTCLLYTSPSPRDYAASRMPSSA